MTKLRIAFIVDAWFPFVGGGQIYARELKRVLEKNNDCTIIVFAPPRADLLTRFAWTFILPLKILISHNHQPFTLIHSQGYHSGLSAKIAQFLMHKPIIHTVHGSNLIDQKKQSFKAKLEKWLLTGITYNALISVTQSFLKTPNKSHFSIYIPNGVDTTIFKPSTNVHKSFDLLWIGRNDWTKGFDLWSEVLQNLEPLNVTSKTILQGNYPQEELAKIYQQAKILVITSRSEGFPLIILEAWATKLAIVSTKVGEIPKLIEDNVTGLLAKPDANEIANKINKLLESPQLQGSLAEKGYQEATTEYSWKLVADKTVSVYKQVITNN